MVLENGDVELNFIEKRRLVASHLCSLARLQREGEWTDLLAQMVARNLPGASLEEVPIFSWGTNGLLPPAVGVQHDLHRLAAARFATDDGEPLLPAALPALGAALQAVGEDAVGINLLPMDKRARREKRLSPLTLVLAGLILMLGVTWAMGVVMREWSILNNLDQQIKALTPEVNQVQAQEEEAARLRERIAMLDETTQKRVVPLLKNLSELIPTDVYLTSFRYRDGAVELSGVAAPSRPASDLVGLLEGSPCLRNAAPKAPFTKTAQGETFTLGAQVDPCE